MLEVIAGVTAGAVIVFLFAWLCSMFVIAILKVAGKFGDGKEME